MKGGRTPMKREWFCYDKVQMGCNSEYMSYRGIQYLFGGFLFREFNISLTSEAMTEDDMGEARGFLCCLGEEIHNSGGSPALLSQISDLYPNALHWRTVLRV
ncbi:hypothetical protein RRG08_019032 [Elysia crispata]|uniref:Uncharacterized protein n=1 Tax=Elysia crispata TaxID=231223 RepID=A0AAE1A6J6_9GAST|nr:hypothetical protein RRG08_019032 [Elysia crispata]